MKKKLLLISYSFPPIAAPESFLSAKTMGGLKDYDITVLSLEPTPHIFSLDNSLNDYIERRFGTIKRISVSSWLKYLVKTPIFGRIIAGLMQFPDRFSNLTSKAVAQAEALGVENFTHLVTWSQFHSSHLPGIVLKKRYPHLKWIAHFSDPWVDNPFNRLQFFTKFKNLRLEGAVVRGCDILVFTSKLTVELVLKKYSKKILEKSFVVPHPYDPELYQVEPSALEAGGPEHSSKTVLFRYIGNFYGNRNPAPLFEGLKKLLKQTPDRLKDVKFEIVGNDKSGFSRSSFPEVSEELVEFRFPVSYRRSLELMQEADVLMVIDAPSEESVFLPSKLVDYIGAGKVLFGITPPGTSEQLIKRYNGLVSNPEDVESISRAILTIIDRVRAKQSGFLDREDGDYAISSVTKAMNRILGHNPSL